jgi:hypothetical protein
MKNNKGYGSFSKIIKVANFSTDTHGITRIGRK